MAPPAWAYQPEYFITPPDDELICSICSLVFCEPTECPCQHAFCKDCIQRWLDRQRDCPICRKPVFMPVRPSAPFIRNLIAKMKMRCHNKEAGCEASFALEACEHHLKECEFEMVECMCMKSIMRKDMQKHNSAECIYGRNSVLLMNETSDAEREKNQIKKELNSLRGKAIGKMAARVSRPETSNVFAVAPVMTFPSTSSTTTDANPILPFPSTSSSNIFSPFSDSSAALLESYNKKRDFLIKLKASFVTKQQRDKMTEARKAKSHKIAEIKKDLLSDSGFALSSPSSSIYAKVNSSGKRGSSNSKNGEGPCGKVQILSSNSFYSSFPPATSSTSGKACDGTQIKTAPSLSKFTPSCLEKGTKVLNYPLPSSSSDISSEKKKKIAAIKNSLLDRDFLSFPSMSSASNYSSASSDTSSEKKRKIDAIKNSLFDNDFPCFPSTSSACATPKTSETSNVVTAGLLEAEASIFDDLMKKIQSIRHKCLNVSKTPSNDVKVRSETGEGGTDVCDIVYDSRLHQDLAKDKSSNSSGSDQKSHDVYEIQVDDDHSPYTDSFLPDSPSSGGNFQLPSYPKGGFSDQDSGSSSSFATAEKNWDPWSYKPLLPGSKNSPQFFHQSPLLMASTSTLSAASMQNGGALNFHELSVSNDPSQVPNQASALQEPSDWEPLQPEQLPISVPWNHWDSYDG